MVTVLCLRTKRRWIFTFPGELFILHGKLALLMTFFKYYFCLVTSDFESGQMFFSVITIRTWVTKKWSMTSSKHGLVYQNQSGLLQSRWKCQSSLPEKPTQSNFGVVHKGRRTEFSEFSTSPPPLSAFFQYLCLLLRTTADCFRLVKNRFYRRGFSRELSQIFPGVVQWFLPLGVSGSDLYSSPYFDQKPPTQYNMFAVWRLQARSQDDRNWQEG